MSQIFVYKARNLSGRIITGKVESENPRAAVELLRERNFFVVELRPARSSKFKPCGLPGLKIKIKDLAVFCRQFATMFEAGIPLLKCFNVLVQQTDNKRLQKILQEVAVDVEKGKSISEAFKSHKDLLPEILINMLAAGEVSGTLEQSLRRLASHFEKECDLKEKIKSAMTYPALVTVMAFMALIALMVFVVPIFVDIFNSMGTQLPLPTRIVIGVSNILSKYWYAALLFPLAVFFAMNRATSTEKGKEIADRLFLRLPIFGSLAHKSIIARFARTLATLLRSGVPLMQSMDIVEKVSGNSMVAKEISKAKENIREGERMAPVLTKSKIFPPMAVNMIAVGEETGALDDLLERLATFYEQEVEAAIARLSSILEPVLIAGVGAMVAFIALSIYLPLFGLAGAMQGGGMP